MTTEVKGFCSIHGEIDCDEMFEIKYDGKRRRFCVKCIYEALKKFGVQEVKHEICEREKNE